jgi:hypothetical protein
MIHHISITAYEPFHVAQVLAELLQGQAVPFPDHLDGFVALSLDAHGTLIVVLPRSLEIKPGLDGEPAQWCTNLDCSTTYSAVHAAISVLLSEAEIAAIAEREGWRMVRCDRGEEFFSVIELWVENHQLIELLTPELAAGYLDFMQPQNLRQFMAS